MRGSRIVARQPLVRHVAGNAYGLIVNAICGLGIRDTQCGMKGFTAAAAEAIFTRMTLNGFGFDVEALFLARRLGLRIQPVAVQVTHTEGSKVRLVRDSAGMLADLLRIRRNQLQGRYRERRAELTRLLREGGD